MSENIEIENLRVENKRLRESIEEQKAVIGNRDTSIKSLFATLHDKQLQIKKLESSLMPIVMAALFEGEVIGEMTDAGQRNKARSKYVNTVLSSDQNAPVSDTTGSASSTEAGKQKLISSLQECIVMMKDNPESVEILTRMIENAKK